jgi:hypothetical protein
MSKEQIKSKERVANHGEVFTSQREVDAMLGLVEHETERADSRFLEPACGNGNFLAPILVNKLQKLKDRYGKSQLEFERYSVVAVGSVYGVDILEDNVRQCRERLKNIFDNSYSDLYGERCKDECREAVRYILSKNIIWGDALSLKTVDEYRTSIVFSEWSLVSGSNMKRRDYTFGELISCSSANVGLFADTKTPVFIPKPIKEYALRHFSTIANENTD